MENLLDLYSDYLISSFGQTTAIGLATLLNDQVSHDQITRMLARKPQTSTDLKPTQHTHLGTKAKKPALIGLVCGGYGPCSKKRAEEGICIRDLLLGMKYRGKDQGECRLFKFRPSHFHEIDEEKQ